MLPGERQAGSVTAREQRVVAAPGAQPPTGRQPSKRPGPAARGIAPSTPPPPSSVVFAALTMASTRCAVMSPSTIEMRVCMIASKVVVPT